MPVVVLFPAGGEPFRSRCFATTSEATAYLDAKMATGRFTLGCVESHYSDFVHPPVAEPPPPAPGDPQTALQRVWSKLLDALRTVKAKVA